MDSTSRYVQRIRNAARELVAFVDIHGTNKRLESVAADGLEASGIIVLILDEGHQADFVGQLVETDTADNLGAQYGEEPFALKRILLVKVVRHDGTQQRIAKILKAFVIDTMAIMLCGQ